MLSWQITLPQFRGLLEIQLQCELNLPRVVWSIAGRSDFAEAGTREVTRSRDRNHSVPSEVRSVEVRMIQDVEELRSKFHPESFCELHFLEQGEVHPLERRPRNLVRRTP